MKVMRRNRILDVFLKESPAGLADRRSVGVRKIKSSMMTKFLI